ncbi:uncharacterized protein LOC127750361 [Frankliniella occidentalis]|uniref:Uncharacterized protein LOC127750361 n=1 Tax=Frankliniella occidentalis TaxID=133901 RepID=A0A9C6XQY7_FRAOC|nr:uncharacterized protein LOC127750361 [Frankliniella occidentalis]
MSDHSDRDAHWLSLIGFCFAAHVFETLLTRHGHQKIVMCPRRGGTKIADGMYSYILAGPAQGVRRQVGYIPPVENRSAHARLLVLVWDCDNGSLNSILQGLWDRAWARVVVAIDNGDNILALFTMAPYLRNDGLCGQSGVNTVFLGNVSVDGKIGLSQHEESLFNDVVPRFVG